MLDQILAYLTRHGIRGPGEILVACSGGPDSTALACALARVGGSLEMRTALAYLDHGLRDARELAGERAAVQALARRLGLQLVEGRLQPGHLVARARARRESLEESARLERQAFLLRVRKERGSRWIAVGHTSDDAAETLIMRLFQGVGVSGLGGIPRIRDPWIRPLIGITRARITAWLREHEIPWVEDTTNRDPSFLRNQVRSRIVPAVAAVFPAYRATLARLARKSAEVDRYVRSVAARSVRWTPEGDGMHADWPSFRSLDGVPRLAALLAALDGLGARRVPYHHLRVLAGPIPAGKRGVLLSGGGYRVERRQDRVWVIPDVVRRGEIGYLVHVEGPGRYAVPGTGIVVEVAPDWSASGSGRSPVVVRTRRPRDKLPCRGGPESLERIVDRCRIAPAARAMVPIVADPTGILCVLGSAVGGVDAAADGQNQPRWRRGAGISAHGAWRSIEQGR